MVLPSGGLAAFSGLDDVGVEMAMYGAYHRFLKDYCAPYPDRLTSVLHVTVRDVPGSVAEIRRCGQERWPVGVFPVCPPSMTLDDPDWDPIWAAAQEHDLTVVIHSFTMPGIAHASLQQKNYLIPLHILHSFFSQPDPVYWGARRTD